MNISPRRLAAPSFTVAVERIADAQRALHRCASLETGLFTAALNEAIPDKLDTQDRAFCLAAGSERLCQKPDSFKLFLCYQAQSERQFRPAAAGSERLNSLRDETPNQPTTWRATSVPQLPGNQPSRLHRANPPPTQPKAKSQKLPYWTDIVTPARLE